MHFGLVQGCIPLGQCRAGEGAGGAAAGRRSARWRVRVAVERRLQLGNQVWAHPRGVHAVPWPCFPSLTPDTFFSPTIAVGSFLPTLQ